MSFGFRIFSLSGIFIVVGLIARQFELHLPAGNVGHRSQECGPNRRRTRFGRGSCALCNGRHAIAASSMTIAQESRSIHVLYTAQAELHGFFTRSGLECS